MEGKGLRRNDKLQQREGERANAYRSFQVKLSIFLFGEEKKRERTEKERERGERDKSPQERL